MNFYRYMLNRRKQLLSAVFALQIGICLSVSVAKAESDALEDIATVSELAQRSLLLDLDRVGNRLVAVGERGHVIISDDNAVSWSQAEVPVRVTLTASYFVDTLRGWAVGHDGVVLSTNDGGQTWNKILDGFQINTLVVEHAKKILSETDAALAKAIKNEDIESIAALELALETQSFFAEDAESFLDEGASRPLLDLWFKDANEGFIVGAYGLILHTADGGEHWVPWFDKLDNPDAFHLNAIRNIGDQLYLAGEVGTLYRSDDWGQSWTLLNSPYDGSFFGVVESGNGGVIAYGLRGNAFISFTEGNEWKPVNTGVDVSFFGATHLSDDSVALVGAGGVVICLDNAGRVIKTIQQANKLPLSAALPDKDNNLLVVGLGGVQPLIKTN